MPITIIKYTILVYLVASNLVARWRCTTAGLCIMVVYSMWR